MTGQSVAQADPKGLLAAAAEEYKQYVVSQVDALKQASQDFTDKIKAGDVEGAKTAYPVARIYYERIELIAESFQDPQNNLDQKIDDAQGGVPFTGFHRLEQGLWGELKPDTNAIADSTGVCIFWTGFWLYPPISVDDQINLMSYATGMDLDEARAITIAKRINALTRAYNVRRGINRRADIKIPHRFFRETPLPPDVKLDRKKFNKMISSFYKLRGWNYKGIPAKKELEKLDLHDVRQDLEQRGYYK